MTANDAPLCSVEIPKRPQKTWWQVVHGALFLIIFIPACVNIVAFQVMFMLPLKFVPLPFAKEAYEEGIRYTKGAFGSLISALFILGDCLGY